VVKPSNFCHTCYGDLLFAKGDQSAAVAEYREAQRLDATDADAHLGLADVFAAQHSDEEALREYMVAEQLDPDSADIHTKVAHFYVQKHRLQDAIGELRDAVVASPTDEKLHCELADLLASTGDNEGALAEYAAVVHLTPRWEEAATKFASLLEKQGQLQNALTEYRRIAQLVPSERTKTQYEQASLRLRPQQPAQQAQPLQAPEVAEERPVENSDLLWRASMDAVKAQLRKGNLTVAAYYSRQAIEFADGVTPHDARLTESLRLLGSIYQRLNKFPQARDQYLRALAVAQETWGNDSEDAVLSLDALGDLAMSLKDYKGAETHYANAVDISRGLYAAGPARDAQLFCLANASLQAGHMTQAESLLQELVTGTKGHDPASESRLTSYVETLANVYFTWGKYQQAEVYYRRTLTLQERQFSARSPMLDHTLYQLALVMSKLGRPKEENAYLVRRMSILTANNARYAR
jgi:tetratricopeptide (TPR) repeat protein